MAITDVDAGDATELLAEIETLIREGMLDEADEAFSSADESVKALARAPLVSVRLHMAQERFADALQVTERELMPKAAENPWFWAQCVDVIATSKGLEDACAFCLDGLAAAASSNPDATMAAVDGLFLLGILMKV